MEKRKPERRDRTAAPRPAATPPAMRHRTATHPFGAEKMQLRQSKCSTYDDVAFTLHDSCIYFVRRPFDTVRPTSPKSARPSPRDSPARRRSCRRRDAPRSATCGKPTQSQGRRRRPPPWSARAAPARAPSTPPRRPHRRFQGTGFPRTDESARHMAPLASQTSRHHGRLRRTGSRGPCGLRRRIDRRP